MRKKVYTSFLPSFRLHLFIYATLTNYQNSNSARQVRTETYTNTVLNVPIDIQYDSDQYFISGFTSGGDGLSNRLKQSCFSE